MRKIATLTAGMTAGLALIAPAFAEEPREPSQAAMDACMNAADAYQEEPTGSSVVKHIRRHGENWVLTMDTGGDTSHCTVSQAGDVIGMDPP